MASRQGGRLKGDDEAGNPLHVMPPDVIHCVSCDYHGIRIATCASDQTIKVWDKDADNTFSCTSSWKAHTGSVWKVVWAHSQFGNILATSSFDRTVIVWEEINDTSNLAATGRSRHHWAKRSSLLESRTSVIDIEFSPRHLGLLLAACSTDGTVTIYDFPEYTTDLTKFNVHGEFSIKMAGSSLSWNTAPNVGPMLAIGSDDASAQINSRVFLYQHLENRKWARVESWPQSKEDPVKCVRFAGHMGRSYYKLAVASRFSIRILEIKQFPTYDPIPGIPRYAIRTAARLEGHTAPVWRISWNITGTVLASCGDDNTIRFWRASESTGTSAWQCYHVIACDSGNLEASHLVTGDKSAVVSHHPISMHSTTAPLPDSRLVPSFGSPAKHSFEAVEGGTTVARKVRFQAES